MVNAARVGDRFAIDPLAVLDTPPAERLLRLAAYLVCQHDDQRRHDEAERQRKRK